MLLSEKQLSQVDSQIKRLIKTDSFYGKKYREMGITIRMTLTEFLFHAKTIYDLPTHWEFRL